MQTITPAHVSWEKDADGRSVLVCQRTGDVYFAKTHGLHESQYVFIEGNDLPRRFEALHASDTLVIGELGFGTGLNLLSAVLAHRAASSAGRLHFISFEKYPLTPAQIARAWLGFEDALNGVKDIQTALLEQYPPLIGGVHRRHLSDNVVLDLWFCDVQEGLNALTGKVDAWFLDGFAPKCCPKMWRGFDVLVKRSRPGATFATFSASGQVRRDLADAGFCVKKRKGFGKKREMLTGTLPADTSPVHATPAPKSAIVVGAGVAGVVLAHQLVHRGVTVLLVDVDTPMQGASGNARGLLAPKLVDYDKTPLDLPTLGFLYAVHFYQRFVPDAFCQTGAFDFCQMNAKTPNSWRARASKYPKAFVACAQINEAQKKTHAKEPPKIALHFPSAGIVAPDALKQTVLDNASDIKVHRARVLSVDAKHITTDKGILVADGVFVCAGYQSPCFGVYQGRTIRGQTAWRRDNSAISTPSKAQGYRIDFDEAGVSYMLLGSSFVRDDTGCDIRKEDWQVIIDKAQKTFVFDAGEMGDWQHKAGVRFNMPDYHPVVGKLSSGAYAFCGFGAKGYTLVPLLSAHLVDVFLDTPSPLAQPLIDKITPDRDRLKYALEG